MGPDRGGYEAGVYLSGTGEDDVVAPLVRGPVGCPDKTFKCAKLEERLALK